MSDLTLVIGNKNYSSWSLRPWLLLRQANVPFSEVLIPLYTPESRKELTKYSPSGLVPVLIDGPVVVWDSLAICEYLAEKFPDRSLWPAGAEARAMARSVSAEMHSGFAALRSNMPMNCRERFPGKGMNEAVRYDIDRITDIWKSCRARFGTNGAMLFGKFSVADAMFAPVALRFLTYGVALDGVAQSYVAAILSLPAVQEWIADAGKERQRIEQFELYQ